ncbi:MAG: ABC transporter permease, partial [Steroidobacteraceae bacterium]
MLAFALRRLLGLLPTLLVIVTAAFFLMRLAPGGPFDDEQALPPEIAANLQAAYGLDQPVHVQFGRYLRGLARGDLGPSFKYKDYSVSELIARGLPVTVTLGLLALVLAIGLGVPLGIAAALRHDRPVDHGVMGVALVGIAVPNFVLAPVLALFFGVYLRWLPVAGWEPGSLRHLVLPVCTLALPFVAYIARLTRGSLLEVLQAPYIRTARA